MPDRKEIMSRVYDFCGKEENAKYCDDIEYLVAKLEDTEEEEERQKILISLEKELNFLESNLK